MRTCDQKKPDRPAAPSKSKGKIVCPGRTDRSDSQTAAGKALPPRDLDEVLAATTPLWQECSGRTFFLTGATGFFGRWLLESFAHANDRLALGMRAFVLTRSTDAFARRAPHVQERRDISLLEGDVRSFTFPETKIDYVIHAAAEASARLNADDPETMFDVIVDGTRRVLELASRAGVEKLLLTSSGAVYGRQPADMSHLSEEYCGGPDPLDPASAYAEAKRAAEHMGVVHARRHGYEFKVARCFAFVGPHLPIDTHFAIGNFLRDALRGGPIQVAGDGTAMRSYLYASDLAVWLWTILFRGPAGQAFNVGSPDGISIGALAEAVRETLGVATGITIAMPPDPTRPVSRYVPSTTKAADVLGLQSTVGLLDAIRRTYDWHRG